MATIDIASFREREAQGLITGRTHPVYDLIIWNYTPQCQFQRAWDDVTMQSRGLITTSDGAIIACPFKKFFNIEEHTDPLPVEPFKVTEKMDGSLGILYHANGKPYIATRGSFTSKQATHANTILQTRYSTFDFQPYYTYLFEIIYKTNRIVVDYGDMEDLVLLAVIYTDTGKEYDIHDPTWVEMWPFPIVKHYDGITDFTALKALEKPNKEGFVIRFEIGLRVKVKMVEYVRLHRLLTQCTARTIWEALRYGYSFDDLLDRVPDEFYVWVKKTRETLQTQYDGIELFAQGIASQVRDLPTRKEQAAIVLQHAYSGVVFSMLDNKPYADAIWKQLKPQAEKPFREDEEG